MLHVVFQAYDGDVLPAVAFTDGEATMVMKVLNSEGLDGLVRRAVQQHSNAN